VDFFTLLLLKPRSFEWAQSFLQSPAWAALNQLFTDNSFSFSRPKSTPSVVISKYSCSDPPLPVCLDLLEDDTDAEPSLTEPSLTAMVEPTQAELMGLNQGTDGADDIFKNTVDLKLTEVVTPPLATPSTSAP
jgi:hypothetical protein